MKKKGLKEISLRYFLFKMLIIMKLSFIILCLTALSLFASESYSQSTKLSLSIKNASINDILNQIENQSEFRFFYSEDINTEMKISIDIQKMNIENILNIVLKDTPISYKIVGRQVALFNEEEKGFDLPALQTKQISGQVTDQSGTPLPGVTVFIKGTTQGTITDADGNYTLSNVQEDGTLAFSFVGMKTQEILVAGKTNINVALVEETIGIEEVVAIGYGTVKKSDLTGAVGSVQGDVIANRQAIQASQALQGAMSGVMVTRNNNAPGSTATIRIRGITTIGDSDPLVIVDGVPAGSINDVNPNDIESISVLKDAASASIYGSRAASGVILITTKRAKTDELGINYNFEYGFEKPTEMSDYVNAFRYMQMVNELGWNDNNNNTGGEYPTYTKDVIDNYASLNTENPDLYPNVNWVDYILKESAPRQSHVVSVTGSSKTIRTKASLAYDEIGGLYIGKNYKRLTARFNNDITINKFLLASFDFYAKRSISEDPSVDPIDYMRLTPSIYAAEWSNGLVAEGKQGTNIYGQIKYGGYQNSWYNKVGGKAAIEFTPFEGLKLSAVVAPELNYRKGKNFLKKVEYTNYDDPTVYVGSLRWYPSTGLNESRDEDYHVTTQLLLNYSKSFGNHNLNAMVGYENYYAFNENLGASSNQFDLTAYPYLDLGNPNYLQNSGSAYEYAYRSWFGRIMYNFNNKYLLQGNIRHDGSSRFHEDYRWGTFPSFSAGWVISEESFMSDIPALSFLKLRGSWGALGNERIGNYPYQSTIAFSSALFYQGYNVSASQTAAQRYYAIRDISWETTESLDVGFDLKVFSNKLSFTGDYYNKVTKDMLLELEIPDYIGFDNPNQNTGKMNTKGWEIELGWNDIIGELRYSISANLSDFKSEMGDLGGIQFLGDQVKFEGSEFNEWYGYKSDGLFQTQEEVDNSPTLNASVKPGDVKYVDISGPDGVPDGIISSEYDRVLLGGSLPRYMYGGNINLQYKNFDLFLAFQGVGKQNVRMTTAMVQPYRGDFGNFQAILDGKYWSTYNSEEQNLKAQYPRFSKSSLGNNYAMSDFWMFNGAYFRLKNITLGYNIPNSITERLHIKDIRIYGSVSDLLSVNKYPKGWDPEISGTGYPITASFIFGVSVKF